MLKPLHDYVLLQKVDEEKTTASGIILSTTKEKSVFAKVVAMGSDVQNADYQVNDKVLYKEYAGTNIKHENEEYIIIKDEDIIAVNK